MSDFQIVDKSFRTPPSGGTSTNPMYEALANGETVFVPLNGRPAHNIRSSASQRMSVRGFRLFSRQHDNGLVLWAEPKAAA